MTHRTLSIAAAIALALILAPATLAQSAPAGNEHPERELVSDPSAAIEHPFGEPAMPTMDLEAKRAFARSVDLSPLADVAVFHNGRVKILDTLAREMVSSMTGRSKHSDILVDADGDPEKVSFAPMLKLS